MINYVTVGAFAYDYIYIPPAEPRFEVGGNGIYAAMGARVWAPGEVGLVSRAAETITNDYLEQIEKSGIDTKGVTKLKGPHDFVSTMEYNKDQSRQSFKIEKRDIKEEIPDLMKGYNPNDQNKRDFMEEKFAPALKDYPNEWYDVNGLMIAARYYDKQLPFVNKFKDKDVPIILDTYPDYMREKDISSLKKLFSGVDVLLPSEGEIKEIWPNEKLEKSAKKLAEIGPTPIVLIKVGKEGSILYIREKDELIKIPPYPAEVVDPTGAGDAFCGGYLVGYCKTNSPIKAAIYGTVSSSFIIEGYGAEYSTFVTKKMASKRYNKVKELM